MEPVYNAPILDIYIQSLPTWGTPSAENGRSLIKILSQIAMCCFVLERDIGFNHRDLKPDNILVKTDCIQTHSLKWKNELEIKIGSSPTAVIVDFGFSCLGPGKEPWIQAGDGVLTPLDSCPKVGRDIFMLLVFLLWRQDVRQSLTDDHLDFFKSSLRLTTGRLSQMMNMNRNPGNWIYMLITEKGFQCPALDSIVWLECCSKKFPDIVSIIMK
jgi:serine/threonine protein kinase